MPKFADPEQRAQGDRIKWAEHYNAKTGKGRIVAIEPKKILHDVKTSNGTAETVVAGNVYVFTKNETVPYHDTLIFPKALVSATENQIGSVVIGRLTKVEPENGNAYWLLEPVEGEVKKRAQAQYLEAVTSDPEGEDDEDDEEDEDDDDFGDDADDDDPSY